MIYLYTEKKEDKNWILQNDLYFNIYTGNQHLSDDDKKVIARIDHAEVTDDNHIVTKYGLGTIRNLSSGCKTFLNVLKNPDKVVSADECGKNVLDLLFNMDEIHLYMSKPERIDIADEIVICFNQKDIVTGKSGYENWWSAEYERRAEDDL